jgi:hypothetical protein
MIASGTHVPLSSIVTATTLTRALPPACLGGSGTSRRQLPSSTVTCVRAA